MSILARIRAAGGNMTRDRYMFRLKHGRLDVKALEWIKENDARVKRELWPLYDAWEERAAIMEYDGGMSRIEAERAAYDCVIGGGHACTTRK